MDVVGNIVTIIDIAAVIRQRVDDVRGFEERTKRLSDRIEILTLVVDPLRNILSTEIDLETQIQSAIRGVSIAVNSLKKCLEEARDFVIKLAAKRLVEKFMKAAKYGDKFQEFSEELMKVHQDLQMALQTEIFLVLTKEQRDKLVKPVEQSSKCFDEKTAKEEDEQDQEKDMSNIMSLLEDLEKDQQESFQSVEKCQKVTLKEQKRGFNETLNKQYEIGKDLDEGFSKIEDGRKKIDEDQETRLQETENKKDKILEDQRQGFSDVVNKNAEIREEQEKGFKNVKNEQQRTLDELRENFQIQENLVEEVQRGQQEGFRQVGEGQQQILEAQRHGFETRISEQIEIFKEQQEAFKYIGNEQTRFLEDQADGHKLFEKGQQFILKGQKEELEMLMFLEDFLTDWSVKLLKPKMEDIGVQISPRMYDAGVSVEDTMETRIEEMLPLQMSEPDKYNYREMASVPSDSYQSRDGMMSDSIRLMAAGQRLDLHDELSVQSLASDAKMIEEDVLVVPILAQDLLQKVMDVRDDQEEGFKNIEEGQQLILKGQQKGFEDIKNSQNQFWQEQQKRIKQNEDDQEFLLEKQQERFMIISDGQDTILEEQKEGFDDVKNTQEKLLEDQRENFEEVEEMQRLVLSEQQEGFRKLSEGQKQTLEDQTEGFKRIEDEQKNIMEDQQQGFGKLSAVHDAIKKNQGSGFSSVQKNQENMSKGQSDMFHSYADYHQKIIEVQQEILGILTRIYIAAKSSEEPTNEEKESDTVVSVVVEDASEQMEATKEAADGASNEKEATDLSDSSDQKETVDLPGASNQNEAVLADMANILVEFDHIEWQQDIEKFLERISEVGISTTEVSTAEDAEPMIFSSQRSQEQSGKPPDANWTNKEAGISQIDGPHQLAGPSSTGVPLIADILDTQEWPHGLCYIKPHNVLAVCHGAPHFTILLAQCKTIGGAFEKIGSLSPGVSSPIWKSHPVDVACISLSDTSETSSAALAVVCARDRFMHIFSGAFPSLNHLYSHPIEPYDVDPTCIAANGRIVVVGTRHSCGQTGAIIVHNLKEMYRGSSEVIQLNFVPLDLEFCEESQHVLVTGREGILLLQTGSWSVYSKIITPPSGWSFRGATREKQHVLALCKCGDAGAVIQFTLDEGHPFQQYKICVESLESTSLGGLVLGAADQLLVAEEWENRVKVLHFTS